MKTFVNISGKEENDSNQNFLFFPQFLTQYKTNLRQYKTNLMF